MRALILVPTRELSEQVRDYLKALSLYCAADVRSVLLSADAPVASQKYVLLCFLRSLECADALLLVVRALLADVPDVIVTTPARIVAHIHARNVNLKDSLEVLVIDEADLVLTYGYDEDIRAVLSHAPKIYQALLMSATLDTDVDELKQLLLRNAAIVKLEETPDHQRLLKEYYV